MRRMSFMLTEPQFMDGSKTVTRRLGWKFLKAGDHLLGVRKAMGLKKGERQHVLGLIEVLSVRREALNKIDSADCVREGFPHLGPLGFTVMFCREMKCGPGDVVTRVEFRRAGVSGG